MTPEIQMHALALARLGLIKPLITHAGITLAADDSIILDEYLAMIRERGFSPKRALGLVLTRYNKANEDPVISAVRQELDVFRREFSEKIRELDEERKVARLRLVRLEKKRPARKSLWTRVKSAFRVLLGEEPPILALPESVRKAA